MEASAKILFIKYLGMKKIALSHILRNFNWGNIRKQLQGFISQSLFTSAGSILIEIEKSTILTQFYRIEIVIKSIFLYFPKSSKIEIEFENRD